MPPRLPDSKRAAILDDIKAGKSAHQTARDHGVAQSTVSRIAKDAGLDSAFDRSQTKKATEAALVDSKAARAVEAVESITVAKWLRGKIKKAANGRDAQGWATAYGIYVDKHAFLDRFDHDGGVEHAKSMLGQLADAIRTVVEQLPPDDDTQP